MIKLTVILEEVELSLLDDLRGEIADVQEDYALEADVIINYLTGRVVMYVDGGVKSVGKAYHNIIDLLDDMGLSPYILEIGVD